MFIVSAKIEKMYEKIRLHNECHAGQKKCMKLFFSFAVFRKIAELETGQIMKYNSHMHKIFTDY